MQRWVTGRRTHMFRLGAVAALLGALLLAALSATAVGATNFSVTVGHFADDNTTCATTGMGADINGCSLRDAVRFANTHAGATDLTTITLPGSINSYTSTQFGSAEDAAVTGDLDIKANVTINGGGREHDGDRRLQYQHGSRPRLPSLRRLHRHLQQSDDRERQDDHERAAAASSSRRAPSSR